MSKLRQPNGHDYPDAAARHLADAAALLPASRFDGAGYLAGYVAECALKSLIQIETGAATISHDLARLQTTLWRLATQAGSKTARYYGPLSALLGGADVCRWESQMRYRGAGMSHGEADRWLREVTDVYSLVIGGLTLDGAI